MTTSCVYENDADRQQHARAMQRLAKDLNIPGGEIQTLYETMLCSLRERARVKDYLTILVSRNVKAVIRGK